MRVPDVLTTGALELWTAVVAPLLDSAPAPEDVKPGWVALGLVFGLAVVTVLLWLSMRKQLGKIDFDEDGRRAGSAEAPPSEAVADGDPYGDPGGDTDRDGASGADRDAAPGAPDQR